jgi:hypothetical protein
MRERFSSPGPEITLAKPAAASETTHDLEPQRPPEDESRPLER